MKTHHWRKKCCSKYLERIQISLLTNSLGDLNTAPLVIRFRWLLISVQQLLLESPTLFPTNNSKNGYGIYFRKQQQQILVVNTWLSRSFTQKWSKGFRNVWSKGRWCKTWCCFLSTNDSNTWPCGRRRRQCFEKNPGDEWSSCSDMLQQDARRVIRPINIDYI